MTNAFADNLTREEIQQLLAAVGVESEKDTTNNIDASEHNWRRPNHFSHDHLRKIEGFTAKVAAAIACKFAELYHSDFNVTVTSTTQHFAEDLLEPTTDKKQTEYHLGITCEQNLVCGLVSIPSQTALIWATQLLGDSDTKQDPDRNLSELEESLLLDVVSLFVSAVSDSSDNCDFHPADSIVKGTVPLETTEGQELCKITFRIEKTGSEDNSEAYFLIPCEKLESLVCTDTQDQIEFSAEELSNAMLNHIQQIPVTVTGKLGSALLTFEEIINLQVDDILLLDKRVDEPVELVVEGRTQFAGHLAKSAGKYAVVITEAFSDNS